MRTLLVSATLRIMNVQQWRREKKSMTHSCVCIHVHFFMLYYLRFDQYDFKPQ